LANAVQGDGRLRWTSVPRWPARQLPAAASYLACCFGDAGEQRARDLLATADREVPVRTAVFAARWDPAAAAEVRRLIGHCFTGVRIILAGPESVVMCAAAAARQLGAATEELVLVATELPGAAPASGEQATDTDAPGEHVAGPDAAGEHVTGLAGRRVFCAACRKSFAAEAALGDVVTCPGCAAGLIVDYRFSRPHAAYFGWPAGLDLHR
jgi:hypothetical protein